MLFVLCCFFLKAQRLEIAKENTLCLFGLKDASGKWVTQPAYTNLERLNNKYFRSFDGVKYGLLNASGEEIVPPKYDKLEYYQSLRGFLVQENQYYGFLNKAGIENLPPIWNYVFYVHDKKQFLLHRRDGDSTVSFFADTTGKVLQGPISGAINPTPLLQFTNEEDGTNQSFWIVSVRMTNYGKFSTTQIGKVGIVDDSGNQITPQIYDKILRRDNESFWVVTDKKLGAVSVRGKVLLEPIYFPELMASSIQEVLIPTDNKLVIVRDTESRYGLLNDKFQLVIPTLFDKIERIKKTELLAAHNVFTLEQSGKMGVADEQGKLLIPVEYDTLLPLLIFDSKQKNERSIHFYGYIARIGEEYAVISGDGTALTGFDYCEWLQVGDHEELSLLIRDQNIQCVTVQDKVLQLVPATLVFTHNEICFYQIEDQLIPLIRENGFWKKVNYERLERPIQLIRVVSPKKEQRVWYDANGNVFGNYASLRSYSNNLLLVVTQSRKYGLIRYPENTFALDTIYSSILSGYHPHIWATPIAAKMEVAHWQVYDSQGKLLSKEYFDEPFQLNDTMVIRRGDRVGVVLPDFTWLISPHYAVMTKFGATSWLVKSVSGGIGAIDSQGKLLADTIYSDVQAVYLSPADFSPKTPSFLLSKGEWWLFKRASDSLLLSDNGQSYGTRNNRQLLFNQLIEAALHPNVLQGAPAFVFYSEEIREIVLNASYKRQLAAKFVKENHDHCNAFVYALKAIDNNVSCSYSSDYTSVAGAGTLFYSTALVNCFTHYSMEEPGDIECIPLYSNYVFTGGRWKEVQLNAIFGSKSTVLKQELKRALDQQEEGSVPCYDPEQLVNGVGGFYLSTEGVHVRLSLGNYSNTLLIPKARLAVLTSAKWLVPLLK